MPGFELPLPGRTGRGRRRPASSWRGHSKNRPRHATAAVWCRGWAPPRAAAPGRYGRSKWAPGRGDVRQPSVILPTEIVPEVELAHVRVVLDVAGEPSLEHLAGVDDVGAVDQVEGRARIVVGDQDADPAPGEVAHQRLDAGDRLGV